MDTPMAQVIIAALNEEVGIGRTISELNTYLNKCNILVVDGRSNDRTVEVAKDFGAQIIRQDGVGKGDAIAKAIQYLDPTIDYAVTIDADYTYPAEYIPGMMAVLDHYPQVGMVCGNRFNGHVDGQAMRNKFYFGNKLLTFAHTMLDGVNLRDPLTGLRVIRSHILRDWQVKSKGFDIEVELNCHVERSGYSIVEIPIQYRLRLGNKKLKVTDGASILKRILVESF